MWKRLSIFLLTAGLALASAVEAKKGSSAKTKRPGAGKADLALGKKTFETYCASCHGAIGKGDGAAAAALNPKPRDFSDSAYMNKRPKDKLRKVIAEGGQSEGFSPFMAAWKGTLKDAEIDAVLAYVLTLSKPAK